uniref:PGG domain-containing protein n=1 Tax=Setaria digitata TaxID=48799 RepID=A0A915Q1B4_9BILA
MLTVFYMLLLAVANFAVDIIAVEPSSFTYAGTVSTVILLAVVLAQYGMWKELSLCRFIMLITGSIIFCVFHCYCIVIMWRCWKYFRYMEKKAALERSWHAETTEDEIDEDILIFNAPSENSNQC